MSEGQPLVTVILPTIGRPNFVVDTVRSILQQDYRHLEILVSDNAASVSTSALLSDARIVDSRLVFRERASRLPSAVHMNQCIKEANGEYVIILSDDDQIDPGYLSEMVSFFQDNPEVTVCVGRQRKINGDDQGLIATNDARLPPQVVDGVSFLRGLLCGNYRHDVLTFISMFARKRDVLEVGGFCESYPDGSHADNMLFVNLALRGRVALGSNIMLYRVYLQSSGLSTPFASLVLATQRYTRDFWQALDASSHLPETDRVVLKRLVKRNNTVLLVSRLRHIYRFSLSKAELARCALITLRFAVWPNFYRR